MKRFRFSLAALLRVRTLAEDTKSRELQTRRAELLEIERDLAAIAVERNEHVRAIADLAQGGAFDAQALVAHRRYINSLNKRSVELAHARLSAEGKVIAAREQLRRASTAREAVERLRDRHYEDYKRELARLEMRELDEFAQAAFHARVAGGER